MFLMGMYPQDHALLDVDASQLNHLPPGLATKLPGLAVRCHLAMVNPEVRGGRGRDQPPAGQGAGVSPLHRSLEDSNVDLFVVRGSTSPSPTLRTSALPSRATESPS